MYSRSLEEVVEEMILTTIAMQEAKVQTWETLVDAGLPVPADLEAQIESMTRPRGYE
jgi:hypothetical protein